MASVGDLTAVLIKDVQATVQRIGSTVEGGHLMRRAKAMLVLVAAVGSMAQTKTPDLLIQARRMYNDQHYEEAIKLASDARQVAALSLPASVVLARAHLEQYRLSPEDNHLKAAREVLKGL